LSAGSQRMRRALQESAGDSDDSKDG
jgi:hypothetical protein